MYLGFLGLDKMETTTMDTRMEKKMEHETKTRDHLGVRKGVEKENDNS